MRVYDWDPIRAEHYGQRPHRPHKQAAHMTAPDQCCRCVRKFLPRRRRPHMTQSDIPWFLLGPLPERCYDPRVLTGAGWIEGQNIAFDKHDGRLPIKEET